MPTRVDARWGRTGMIRLAGRGQVDDRENGTNDNRKKDQRIRLDCGHQGFLLNDVQFNSLIEGLDPSKYLGHQPQLRAELDRHREFVLKSYLRAAETPTRAEINKALGETSRQLRVFLDRISALAFLPDWHLADSAAIEDPSPFHVFLTLPSRLRAFAEKARSETRMDKERAPILSDVADGADDLADILIILDFASKDEALKHMPWTNDYHLDSLDEVVGLVRRVSVAVDEALAAGKKGGGPSPRIDLKQTTVWLANVFESYGARFAHNPYNKTRYDGRPHSAAGKFILAFLRTCDSTITETAVSYYMAEVVRFRNRGERGLRMDARETSS